jgi:CRISPR-associated protein Cmr6
MDLIKPINQTCKGNIGLWYYRSFFSDFHRPETPDQSDAKKFADWLQPRYEPKLKAKWGSYSIFSALLKSSNVANSFSLKTIYPGLVCGIGYEHELGFTNEFKLGFSFDHTTGLPYIPGSSVKGTLRSGFKHNGYPKSIIQNWKEKPNECPDALKNEGDLFNQILTVTDWKKMEDHIFEGVSYFDGKDLSTYQIDAFFDAFISKNENDNDFFLADDYITCHQNNKHPELTPFTNPNPVRFLKVRSDVEFTFGFRLLDIKNGDKVIFPAKIKRELFKQILIDLGIGAKTNVGYGQFEQ